MKGEKVLGTRGRLAEQLLNPAEIVRGSFLQRTIRHRRGYRKCEAGGGRPVRVLTVSNPGSKTRRFSLRREQGEQEGRRVRNHRRLKERLEAIL
jgi:hypothetical protein